MSTQRQRDTSDWELGSVSAYYEGGSKGPGTVSSGVGDHGGVSYGLYQFSTKSKTINEFVKASGYSSQFGNLQPDTKEFNDVWKNLGASDPDFATAQIDYAKKNYYDQTLSKLEKQGIDLSHRSMGVQEAIWSTSIQYGAKGATRKFVAIEEQAKKSGKSLNDMSDEEIVSAVQDRKLKDAKDNLQNAKHNLEAAEVANPNDPQTKDLHAHVRVDEGVVKRISQEKDDLLKLSRNERPDYENLSTRLNASKLQKELNGLGYKDYGYNKLGEDGQLGKETRYAVKKFQRGHNLEVTGIIDPVTEKAINTAYEEKVSKTDSQSIQQEPPPHLARGEVSAHSASDTKQTLEHARNTESQTHPLPRKFHEPQQNDEGVKIRAISATPEEMHKTALRDAPAALHQGTYEHQVPHEALHKAIAPLLKEGSQGDHVLAAQVKLNKLNYTGPHGTNLALDGKFGAATEHAVREFQKASGLTQDGMIGAHTGQALDKAYKEAQKYGQSVSPQGMKEAFKPVTTGNKATQAAEPEKKQLTAEERRQEMIRSGLAKLAEEAKQRHEAGLTETQDYTQSRGRGMRMR